MSDEVTSAALQRLLGINKSSREDQHASVMAAAMCSSVNSIPRGSSRLQR